MNRSDATFAKCGFNEHQNGIEIDRIQSQDNSDDGTLIEINTPKKKKNKNKKKGVKSRRTN